MELKLGFAHNRKTGGKSIQKFFKENKYSLVDLQPGNVFAPANGIISFGVIRNPYTRCISSWKYCESTRTRTLLDCLKTPPDKNVAYCTHGHDYKHFTLPQSHWLYHPTTNKRVYHLIKFENLEEEIYNLCDQYGIEIKKMFPKSNVGVYDRNIQLTSEEKEAIYNFYKVDFDTFGFKKE